MTAIFAGLLAITWTLISDTEASAASESGQGKMKFRVLYRSDHLPAAAFGYETDQITNRGDPVEDSTDVLNRKVNKTITSIVEEWDRGHDEMAFVNAIYRDIGGVHWVDRIERWAMRSW